MSVQLVGTPWDESVRRAFLDHLTRQELVEHGDIMRRVVLATRHRDDEASDAV